MNTPMSLFNAVRDAWSSIPTPDIEDMRLMEWGWGEEAARAFTGTAPIDVDLDSCGFHAATPLFELPPRAAAAYLGTFLMSLLRGLDFQQTVGVFDDILARAHTLAALGSPGFWNRVIRPCLPPKARRVLADVIEYLGTQTEHLALSSEQARVMRSLAAEE